MKECIHERCYVCKHFYATLNKFENHCICGCTLHKKYVTEFEVTLIVPAIMLNGKDFP